MWLMWTILRIHSTFSSIEASSLEGRISNEEGTELLRLAPSFLHYERREWPNVRTLVLALVSVQKDVKSPSYNLMDKPHDGAFTFWSIHLSPLHQKGPYCNMWNSRVNWLEMMRELQMRVVLRSVKLISYSRTFLRMLKLYSRLNTCIPWICLL
ncbi:probable serine/threonine-protein kinase BSK3 [Lolium perenne]|uniref:probable serine/threonine-protein kinase BSK3 n=1 Tax=Lolium perenne TaxID=4522 RepID=UPI0021F5A815|nr:probable serine/threonine-protein kinase BSK3 [Lolium perenne]XP_051194437.1 probable serine/threonine-protein kinase BSK3 [Lolium perenne]XP_051209717.1 probable serine/threonine-protein kinase BSK3 [Lolium perenne]